MNTKVYFGLFQIDLAKAKMNQQAKPFAVMKSNMAKILVMDDESCIRDMMGDMLRFYGYEVTLVNDGAKVLELLEDTPFDLCILDVSVPAGLGALETIQQMKEKGFFVKSLLSTGYSDIDIVKNYQDYGFCGLLKKPFDLEEIKDFIDSFLD
ncbi:response regulator [bacterium]|nr:response regulator [bacterium]